MRILFVPHTSSRDILHTDPSYAFACNFFLSWLTAKSDNVLYWVVPTGATTQQKQAFKKLDPVISQVRFIEANCHKNQVVEQNTLPESVVELFHVITGTYLFDCLITEKPGTISQFLTGAWIWHDMWKRKTVVGGFQYMMDNSRRVDNPLWAEYAQIAGSLTCDYLQFCSPANTQDCRGYWVNKLLTYCSSAVAQKAVSIPHGFKSFVDIPLLNALYEGREVALATAKEGFQVHYAFGMNSMQFNFDEVVKAMTLYSKMDTSFRFLITTPSKGGGSPKLDELKFLTIYRACTRERFFQLALRSHAFVFNYDQEGANSGSVWEMSMLGVLPIFKSGCLPYPWYTEYRDYPFQFKDEVQLIALLKWIKTHQGKPETQKIVDRNREIITKVANSECSNDVRWQWIEADQATKLHSTGRVDFSIRDFIDGMPDKILLSHAADIIRLRSHSGVSIGDKKLGGVPNISLYTLDSLRQAMKQKGYVDRGGLDDPILERIK